MRRQHQVLCCESAVPDGPRTAGGGDHDQHRGAIEDIELRIGENVLKMVRDKLRR